ncbi:MAG TPA: helix-turn-helix domain-containing protein [Segeticoccus sp.]|nr:helix-turn-helix domain-containing protein [Segeticoccus sp.]
MPRGDGGSDVGDHPLVEAVRPLVDRVGGQLLPAASARDTDVPLRWDGELVAAVRVPEFPAEAAGLDALLDSVAAELGAPLDGLSRPLKQRAVRLLEERGAFEYRKSAELIAEALGVSRFTVYNYLNRGVAG